MGRDKFEDYCYRNGFYVNRKVTNYWRTTDSRGVIRFDNLLINLNIRSINQVFSSDITYFDLNNKFYYLTFILDCYSRRIVGHNVSKGLSTVETSLPALKMAIKTRGNLPEGIIFHSDGGGQYYAKEFIRLTGKYKIKNSMCEFAYENGQAERVNGIIKNNYLRHWQIETFDCLVEKVDRAVYLYNYEKPHSKLQRLTPIAFEKKLVSLYGQTKPMMRESLEANSNLKGDLPPLN